MPLDLVGAEKVTQLRLGREFKFIEVAMKSGSMKLKDFTGILIQKFGNVFCEFSYYGSTRRTARINSQAGHGEIQ